MLKESSYLTHIELQLFAWIFNVNVAIAQVNAYVFNVHNVIMFILFIKSEDVITFVMLVNSVVNNFICFYDFLRLHLRSHQVFCIYILYVTCRNLTFSTSLK